MYVEAASALVKMHNEMCEIYQIAKDENRSAENAVLDILSIASEAID
jgi:hypothetical protein